MVVAMLRAVLQVAVAVKVAQELEQTVQMERLILAAAAVAHQVVIQVQ